MGTWSFLWFLSQQLDLAGAQTLCAGGVLPGKMISPSGNVKFRKNIINYIRQVSIKNHARRGGSWVYFHSIRAPHSLSPVWVHGHSPYTWTCPHLPSSPCFHPTPPSNTHSCRWKEKRKHWCLPELSLMLSTIPFWCVLRETSTLTKWSGGRPHCPPPPPMVGPSVGPCHLHNERVEPDSFEILLSFR